MAFIYKIQNIINDKIYIGKSKHNDPAYLGSGLQITNAIKKYGKENFIKVILEECIDDIVNDREIFWISYYNSTDNEVGYNISKGGTGGNHYWHTLTEDQRVEHKRKISEARTGQKIGPRSEETKIKQSISFREHANNNPNFFKQRALAKCKKYTCVNHTTKEIFNTNNLADFCLDHDLDKSAMQHNSRSKKTMCNGHWSCRQGHLTGPNYKIIDDIEHELRVATAVRKEKMSKLDRSGPNNSMYGKRHRAETIEKMKLSRKRKGNDHL